MQCHQPEKWLKLQNDIIKIHVLHVTTREEVDFLAMHKKNVTFETTPQHLTLYVGCYDKLGTYAQMNPPLELKNITTVSGWQLKIIL